MTDKLRAAAEAALKAWDTRAGIDTASKAFEAIRAALAESVHANNASAGHVKNQAGNEQVAEPVAAPHTGEYIDAIRAALCEAHAPGCALLQIPSRDCDCRQEDAEPVAWMVYTEDGKSVYVTDNPADIKVEQRALPLYTTPPRREWVSLTDEERLDFFDDYLARTPDGRHLFRHSWSYAEEEREAFDAGVATAEAALKEKNGA